MFSPTVPAPEAIVTMRPHPRAHMPLITARQQFITPYRFTSIGPRHDAGSESRNWVGTMRSAPPLPALFTRMSNGPRVDSIWSTARTTAS